jgi:hypothetical protein
MMLIKKNLKKLLKEIRKANRNRKRNEPMIDFTLMVKTDGVTFPGRVGFISGQAPVTFWESKQAENIFRS